jgi:excisionase family DNA binding protein
MSSDPGSQRPAWTLSEREFWERQREIVRDALSELLPSSPARLLTLEETAQLLRCSPRHVRRLRSEGLPVLMVGEAPRFERDAVLAWLRARSG